MGNISTIKVPNEGDPRSKLWLIGEAPGEYEERERRPFVGPSGQKLMDALSACGIRRDQVYLANCSTYRPSGNDFDLLVDSPSLKQDLHDLFDLATKCRPNCIGLLGAVPLRTFTQKSSISSYRGSIMVSAPANGTKVIPTYHPSYILRVPSAYPIFLHDLQRIVADAQFSDLALADRNYIIDPRPDRLAKIGELIRASPTISVDIECTRPPELAIICVGFALSPHLAICVPYNATNREWLRSVVEDDSIRKIYHNGQFDVEVLHFHGIEARGYWFDTMVAQHILEPELPKRLDFLSSIYTREPYYKSEGRGELPEDTKAWSTKVNKSDVYVYNAKDCAVTFEIHQHQLRELEERNLLDLYEYEHSLIPIATHISRIGMGVDNGLLAQVRMGLEAKLIDQARHLNELAEIDINAGSPAQVNNLLYEILRLPSRAGGSTGEDALISLIGFCSTRMANLTQEGSIDKWKKKRDILQLILDIRETKKYLSSYINIRISDDNRIRSSYGVAGTETGRWSARKYIDGTGLNSQTFPRGEIEWSEGSTPTGSLR